MKKQMLMVMGMLMIGTLSACGQANKKETVSAESVSQEAAAEESKLDFPKDDIKIIVPYDAGGGNDIYARVMAKTAMENGYFDGANIVVENMPGGGGTIAQNYVVNTAPADGYTILGLAASAITNPILKDVSFTMDDFKVLVCSNTDPIVMVARPDAPFDDVEGLLDYAKDHTVIINDTGFGTSSHIRVLQWTSELEKASGQKIEYNSVHEDSGAIQISELMGGHVDIATLSVGEVADAVSSGNVKAIGVMDKERSATIPDVKTFMEQGYDLVDSSSRAVAVNAKVPDEVYEYLVSEFTALCSSDEFKKAMEEANLTPCCISADEYQEFIDRKTELVSGLKEYLLSGEIK